MASVNLYRAYVDAPTAAPQISNASGTGTAYQVCHRRYTQRGNRTAVSPVLSNVTFPCTITPQSSSDPGLLKDELLISADSGVTWRIIPRTSPLIGSMAITAYSSSWAVTTLESTLYNDHIATIDDIVIGSVTLASVEVPNIDTATSVIDTHLVSAGGTLTNIHGDLGTSGTLHTDLTTLHTDLGTTIHGDLGTSGTLHTDLGTVHADLGTLHTDLGSSGTLHTDLATLHTDLGTTIHGDLGSSGTLHTDLVNLHTDAGTTLHTDLTTLHTDVGTTIHGDLGTSGTLHTDLVTLHTDAGTTLHADLGTLHTDLSTGGTLHTDLVNLHTDAGTTLHADLGTLHTDLGTTIHGDLGSSGTLHTDLSTLHTDIGTTVHNDLTSIKNNTGWATTATPGNNVVTCTNANTEYNFTLSAAKTCTIWCRSQVDIRIAFATGKVATPTDPYLTIPAFGFRVLEIPQGTVFTGTVYVASGVAGAVVEYSYWT